MHSCFPVDKLEPLFEESSQTSLSNIGKTVTIVTNVDACKVHCLLEQGYECQAILFRGSTKECYLASTDVDTGITVITQTDDEVFLQAGKE